MYRLEDPLREFMDQDTAIMQALEQTDCGLFDYDEPLDEEIPPLGAGIRRGPARRQSPT